MKRSPLVLAILTAALLVYAAAVTFVTLDDVTSVHIRDFFRKNEHIVTDEAEIARIVDSLRSLDFVETDRTIDAGSMYFLLDFNLRDGSTRRVTVCHDYPIVICDGITYVVAGEPIERWESDAIDTALYERLARGIYSSDTPELLRLDLTDTTWIELRVTGETLRITDEADVARIVDNFGSIDFRRGEPEELTYGWSYMISFYGEDGVIASTGNLSSGWMLYNGYKYHAETGSIDTGFFDTLLALTESKEFLASERTLEYINNSLAGAERARIIDAWGEPDSSLSGLDGDVYLTNDGTARITVIYDGESRVFAIRITFIEPDGTEVPAFSLNEAYGEYYDSEAPGVQIDGFEHNDGEYEITLSSEAIERAKLDCTVDYDSISVAYDKPFDTWRVVFFTDGVAGGNQTVYVDGDGMTHFIVYGE